MSSLVSCAATRLLDWLVPRDCLGCATQLSGDPEWCSSCKRQLESNSVTRVGDLRLVAPFRHSGPIRHAIHRLKYEARSEFSGRLVASGFTTADPGFGRDVVLVPVPLHPVRLVERGYNQSALLARALGRRLRLPVAFELLVRHTSTQSQVGRGRQQRTENVRGAFSVRASKLGQRGVWLVDDVVTTGATAFSCRWALEAAGVSVLGVVAVGHASRVEPVELATTGNSGTGSEAMRHFALDLPYVT